MPFYYSQLNFSEGKPEDHQGNSLEKDHFGLGRPSNEENLISILNPLESNQAQKEESKNERPTYIIIEEENEKKTDKKTVGKIRKNKKIKKKRSKRKEKSKKVMKEDKVKKNYSLEFMKSQGEKEIIHEIPKDKNILYYTKQLDTEIKNQLKQIEVEDNHLNLAGRMNYCEKNDDEIDPENLWNLQSNSKSFIDSKLNDNEVPNIILSEKREEENESPPHSVTNHNYLNYVAKVRTTSKTNKSLGDYPSSNDDFGGTS